MLDEPLEAAPRGLRGLGKGGDRGRKNHHHRRGGEEDDLAVDGRALPGRTHLPLVGGEPRAHRRRCDRGGPAGRARPDRPLDLVDEPADGDRLRPLDPGAGGLRRDDGQEAQGAQPRELALAVRRRQRGRVPALPLESDEGPRLARRDTKPLAGIGGRRRKAHESVESSRVERRQQTSHLPVDALQGADGGPQAPVEGERVEVTEVAREMLDVLGERLLDGVPIDGRWRGAPRGRCPRAGREGSVPESFMQAQFSLTAPLYAPYCY